MEEKISDNIKKYYNIIQRYRNGEFGKEHLTLHEILTIANEQNLLNDMTITEVQYLCEHSSGMLKLMFLSLQKQKLTQLSDLSEVNKLKRV